MDTGTPVVRTRRAGLISVGVTAAVAAAVVAGVAVAPHESAPGDAPSAAQAGSGDANHLLLAAAERSTTTAQTGGRYLTLQTEGGFAVPVAAAGGTYTVFDQGRNAYWLARSGADESWATAQSLGVTPATPEDEAAWRRAGSPSVVKVTYPKPAELRTTPGRVYGNTVRPEKLFAIGNRNVTVEQLGALPTTPAALRDRLLSYYDGGGSDMPTDRNQWLFTVATSVLIELPLSNAIRAAAFGLLAELPGVRPLGPVRDKRGRPGQAVAYVEDSKEVGSFEIRLIIDPATGQPLSRERRAVRPSGELSWIKPGALCGYTLVLVSKTTDDNPPKVDVTG